MAPPRRFEIASEHRILLMAQEIYTLLLKSVDASRSLDATLRLLYDSGSSNITHSRTIALVSEAISLQLLDRNEDLAEDFKDSLARLAANVFVKLWHIDTLPSSNHDLAIGAEYQPSHDQLSLVSTFIADLYAMGPIPREWLSEFVSFCVERFTHRDQLSHLEAMLSRANSYMGERLPVSLYLKIASDSRKRCREILRHDEMTEQEFGLRRLIRALIRDALHEDSVNSRHSSILYQHIPNDDFNCDMMMLDNINDLEELYRLEIRDELNATPVSDTDSMSSLSSYAETGSPEGLKSFLGFADSDTPLSDADSEEDGDESGPCSPDALGRKDLLGANCFSTSHKSI